MPDKPTTAYLQAIQDARNKVLNSNGIPRAANNDFRRIYGQMLRDINRDLSSETITAERANALKRQIIQSFNKLEGQMNLLFDNSRLSAAKTIAEGHSAATAAASRAAGVSLSVNFNSIPQQALRLMMAKRGLQAKNYKSVINRNLQAAADEIDDFLASAVSRGVSTERAGKELAGILSNGNDKLLRIINNDKYGRMTPADFLKNTGVDINDYRQARKLYYDSRRIINTETITAFRESDVISQSRSPVVEASQWSLSGNHDRFDSCDALAELDQYGLGEGIFPSRNVPSSQHAFCSCYIIPITRQPSRWDQPKQTLVRPNRVNKSDLNRLMEGETDNYIQRQVDAINKYQGLAYQVAKKAEAA